LADESGWTVAHSAADEGLLPEDFDQWGLTDKGGVSVLSCLLHTLGELARWDTSRPLCKTAADWEVFKKELPEVYSKYSIQDIMPSVQSVFDAEDGLLHGI
jgi:hypothetical protein